MVAVGIIGGGVTGLSAAWRLAQLGLSAELFEASPRIGGRVSTVERGTLRFDDGAQFIRTETEAARRLLLEELPGEPPLNIERDVRPFDRKGVIGPGDPAQNSEPKWVYRLGLRELPHRLAEEARCHVHLGWRAKRVLHRSDGWLIEGERGYAAPFAALLVTAPPAAARELLASSDVPAGTLLAFEGARHRPIVSVAFESAAPIAAPENAYALVNTDRKHTVSWLAFEEAKPGYVPPGRQVLVAQMAAAWSETRLRAAPAGVAREAVREVGKLLQARLTPRWWHVTAWTEALPDTLAASGQLAAEADGLYFAGDSFRGGRVHLALEEGLADAERIAASL